MTSFWCLYCHFLTNFTLCSGISIADFEQQMSAGYKPDKISCSCVFCDMLLKVFLILLPNIAHHFLFTTIILKTTSTTFKIFCRCACQHKSNLLL